MTIKPNWIESAKYETRSEGEVRSLCVMIEPDVQTSSICYIDLVAYVTTMFANMVGDCAEWEAEHVDVMAWSKSDIGIYVPYLYRVTVDFRRKGADKDGDDK